MTTTTQPQLLSCGHAPAPAANRARSIASATPNAKAASGIVALLQAPPTKCGIGGYYCSKEADGDKADVVYNLIVEAYDQHAACTQKLDAAMNTNKRIHNNEPPENAMSDDMLAQLGTSIFELCMEKHYWAWTMRQLDRKIATVLCHFLVQVPEALSNNTTLRALMLPHDERRMPFEQALQLLPATGAVRDVLGVKVVEGLDFSAPLSPDFGWGIWNYPTLEEVSVEATTNDRILAIDALARASLKESRAWVFARHNYRFDPLVPVKARRSMSSRKTKARRAKQSTSTDDEDTSPPAKKRKRGRRATAVVDDSEQEFDPYEEDDIMEEDEIMGEDDVMESVEDASGQAGEQVSRLTSIKRSDLTTTQASSQHDNGAQRLIVKLKLPRGVQRSAEATVSIDGTTSNTSMQNEEHSTYTPSEATVTATFGTGPAPQPPRSYQYYSYSLTPDTTAYLGQSYGLHQYMGPIQYGQPPTHLPRAFDYYAPSYGYDGSTGCMAMVGPMVQTAADLPPNNFEWLNNQHYLPRILEVTENFDHDYDNAENNYILSREIEELGEEIRAQDMIPRSSFL